MKKFLPLFLLLLACGASSTPKPAPVPVVNPPLVQEPVVIKPRQIEAPPSIYQGDGWALKVADGLSFKMVKQEKVELLLKDTKNHRMAFIERADFDGTLQEVVAKVAKMLHESDIQISRAAKVLINDEMAVELEEEVADGRVWQWIFATGSEVISVSCGGMNKDSVQNREACIELIKGFHLDTSISTTTTKQ